MNLPSKIAATMISALLLWTTACQGMSYGMRPAFSPNNSAMANRARGDFEPLEEDKDKIGTWIFVGIAAAAGIAAAVFVPLYLNDKL